MAKPAKLFLNKINVHVRNLWWLGLLEIHLLSGQYGSKWENALYLHVHGKYRSSHTKDLHSFVLRLLLKKGTA